MYVFCVIVFLNVYTTHRKHAHWRREIAVPRLRESVQYVTILIFCRRLRFLLILLQFFFKWNQEKLPVKLKKLHFCKINTPFAQYWSLKYIYHLPRFHTFHYFLSHFLMTDYFSHHSFWRFYAALQASPFRSHTVFLTIWSRYKKG